VSENLELHRRAIEAFNARDREAIIALFDPQIEFHSMFAVVDGVYHGHDGMRRFQADLEDAWGDQFRLEPEAYFDLGEHTVAFYALRGRGKQSGAEVALAGTHVFRWRNGLIIYFKAYAHREDALTDLGVSEDALEPIEP
jgi:hypothetical protein